MNPRILKRFIILMAVLTVVAFLTTDFWRSWSERPPGDLETELASQRLEDKLYDQALALYDQALKIEPNHRGALMGRAIVFLQTEQLSKAVSAFDQLIEFLEKSLEQDDLTGRGVLAAAYANRGIARDRMGEFEKALKDYVKSLNTDETSVEGPGTIHKILYGSERVSNVRSRAIYIYEQLKKPEDQRVMRIPELDQLQRMHKP